MEDLSERLSKLGAAVADADAPDAGAIAEAKRRFGRGRRAPARRAVAPLVAIAAVALLGIASVIAMGVSDDDATESEAPAIELFVGAAREEGRAGQWIAATHAPTPLWFSEGTAITVQSDARARVSELSRHGASLDLERGSLTADVAHREASAWSFRAGPYTVRVTGTRFELAWDPVTEELFVAMHEGSVEVTGPDIARPQSVVAGQTLRASHREGRMELARGRNGEAVDDARAATAEGRAPLRRIGDAPSDEATVGQVRPETNGVEPVARTLESATPASEGARRFGRRSAASGAIDANAERRDERSEERGGSAEAHGEDGPAGDDEPRWRALLARGSHAAAIEAAEREGFARVLLSAEPSDLYRLADAARLIGRSERARAALVALRTRHGERGRTAFLLGRIAHESGDRAGAIRWLETYLDESPGGALEESALGRLLELERDGDPVSARTRAERYLERYPHGAHADLARSVRSR